MVENHNLNFSSLIEPLTVEEFEQEYKGKKFCIIKGNKFRQKFYKDIITWTKFSDYKDEVIAGAPLDKAVNIRGRGATTSKYIELPPRDVDKDF